MNKLKNWYQNWKKFVYSDFQQYPARFMLEVIGWVISIGSASYMSLTMPDTPMEYVYPIWVVNCLIYSWSSYTRGSFGMLANYLLLITIDIVGFISVITNR
jgi:hypothetical protein